MNKSIAAIQQAPWTKPLDWNLRVNLTGEPQISFARSVQLDMQLSVDVSFSLFAELPIELQLLIISFCDRPTLYALMQVSSTLRSEAKKLFWSYPDAWYLVEGRWLLAGGYQGETHHALDFMTRVTHVEIHFAYVNGLSVSHNGVYRNATVDGVSWALEDRVQVLWQSLIARFPKVTHVIVSESKQREIGELLPQEMVAMLRVPPAGVKVFASTLRKNGIAGQVENSFWEQSGANPSLVEENHMHTRIIPPAKIFRGPVGDFQHVYHQSGRLHDQRRATRYILIEARERQHFDGRCEPFGCIDPSCNARFEQPGQWTEHAFATIHDWKDDRSYPLDVYKDVFKEREKGFRELQRRDLDEPLERMSDQWWSKPRIEARRKFEESFFNQVLHDPLYKHGQPPRACSTFQEFLMDMGSDSGVVSDEEEEDEMLDDEESDEEDAE
jgi:hypothetical protein